MQQSAKAAVAATLPSSASASSSPAPAALAPLSVAPAREPPLAKGMNFPNSKAAFYAVQDYALFHGKQVKVARRGGKHRRMVCASRAPCTFFVQLYLHNSKTDHTWYVSSAELHHAPGCDSTAKPTQRQIMASASFKQALTHAPNGTATQLQKQIQGKANVRTIYRAKQSMKRELLNQLSASFRKIPSLLRTFQELNPGSVARYDVGGAVAGAFSRAFVSCGVFTASTALNQQVYGFECVPCANRAADYEGVQLFLLGKDGNMQTVTVAAACCDDASQENLRWFFRCVEASGVNLRSCPILCAIDTKLLALEAELGLTLRYCTRFIIERQMASQSVFNPLHHALVWDLQRSESTGEYENRLEWIGETCGPGVANYLRQFPMKRWTVAGNRRHVALYGWRSRTFVDSVEQKTEGTSRLGLGLGGSGTSGGQTVSMPSSSGNLAAAAIAPSTAAEALQSMSSGGADDWKMASASTSDSHAKDLKRLRSCLPFAFLEAVMLSFMQDAYERSTQASKWKQENRKVTLRAQELYDTQCLRIGEYKVSRASDSVAYVMQMHESPSDGQRVDLQASTCTCAFIDQYAIPCRHLIAALLFCRQIDSVCDRFAPGYLVDNYALAFQGKSVELPLQSALSEDLGCERAVSAASSRRVRTANSSADESGQPASAASKRRTIKRPAPASGSASADGNGAQVGAGAGVGGNGQPSAVPRTRLCKKCRGPGHNARSCSFQTPGEPRLGP